MVVVYFEKDCWGDSDGRTVLQGGVHAFIEVLWATHILTPSEPVYE